jgi:hypothetical protein
MGINVTLIFCATINSSCMHVLRNEVVGPIICMGLEHGMVIIGSCTIVSTTVVNIPCA